MPVPATGPRTASCIPHGAGVSAQMMAHGAHGSASSACGRQTAVPRDMTTRCPNTRVSAPEDARPGQQQVRPRRDGVVHVHGEAQPRRPRRALALHVALLMHQASIENRIAPAVAGVRRAAAVASCRGYSEITQTQPCASADGQGTGTSDFTGRCIATERRSPS